MGGTYIFNQIGNSFLSLTRDLIKNTKEYNYLIVIVTNMIILNILKEIDNLSDSLVSSLIALSLTLFVLLVLITLPIPLKIFKTPKSHKIAKIALIIGIFLYCGSWTAYYLMTVKQNDLDYKAKVLSYMTSAHQIFTIFLFCYFNIFRKFKGQITSYSILSFSAIFLLISSISIVSYNRKNIILSDDSNEYTKNYKINIGFKMFFSGIMILTLIASLAKNVYSKGDMSKLMSFVLFCVISIVYIGFSFISSIQNTLKIEEYNKVQNQEVKISKNDLDVADIIQATNITNSISSKIPLIFLVITTIIFISFNYKLRYNPKVTIGVIALIFGYFLLFLTGAKESFNLNSVNAANLFNIKNLNFSILLGVGITFLVLSFIGLYIFGIETNKSKHLVSNKGKYMFLFIILSAGSAALSFFHGKSIINISHEPFSDIYLNAEVYNNGYTLGSQASISPISEMTRNNADIPKIHFQEYIENSINQKKLYTHIYTDENTALYNVRDAIVFRRYKINEFDYNPIEYNNQLNILKIKIKELKENLTEEQQQSETLPNNLRLYTHQDLINVANSVEFGVFGKVNNYVEVEKILKYIFNTYTSRIISEDNTTIPKISGIKFTPINKNSEDFKYIKPQNGIDEVVDIYYSPEDKQDFCDYFSYTSGIYTKDITISSETKKICGFFTNSSLSNLNQIVGVIPKTTDSEILKSDIGILKYYNMNIDLIKNQNQKIRIDVKNNNLKETSTKFSNGFGFGFIITCVISIFIASGLYFGYEVIFDRFKISSERTSESNIFVNMIGSVLVPLLFLSLHSLTYAANTMNSDTINIWSSVINLILVTLYISSIVPRGYKIKIICFGIIAILNLSLFTVPEIGNLLTSNISIFISLFIVMILAIKNAITPGDKHSELVKIIFFSGLLIGIFYSAPKVIKSMMEREFINIPDAADPKNQTSVQKISNIDNLTKANSSIKKITENIVEIGNNSWPALIIGVAVFVLIEKFIMNPYVITKIPFKPSKEDFFASELHEK